MKKLIILLVLCLCMNGLTGVSFAGQQSTRAKASSATEEKAKKKTDKKKEKEGKSKKADEKAKKEKKAKEEEKSKEKTKKTEKEERYELDLAKNGTFSLSSILKAVKMGIKLEDVKSIEYENKKEDKKRITWEPDEENEKDYIFTVLKNFKKVQLRIITKKKDSKLLVLLNGAKAKNPDADKEKKKDDSQKVAKAPVKEEKKGEETGKDSVSAKDKNDKTAEDIIKENIGKAVAAEAATKPENELEAPVGISVEKIQVAPFEEAKEFLVEMPVEDAQETPTEKKPVKKADPAPAEPSKDGVSDADGEKTKNKEKPTEFGIEGDLLTELANAAVADGLDEMEDSANFEIVVDDSSSKESQGESTDGQGEPTDGQGEPTDGQGEPTGGEGQGEPTGGEGEGEPTDGEGEGEPTDGEGEGEPTDGEGEDEPTDGEGEGEPTDGEGEDEPTDGEGGATIPTEAEAWFKRNGELFWGTLEQIVTNLTGGETVYIQSTDTMTLREAPLQLLSTVTLLPDGSVFQGGYVVNISTDDPAVASDPVLLQPAQMAGMGEKADLFIWVGEEPSQPPEEEETGKDVEKPVLTVTATGLAESGWSTTQPQFTLSGIPEDKNWSYAAIIYDEKIVPIAGDVYQPDAEGVYALRFAMLDELGDIMSASDQYSLQLDWTAPEVSIESDEETSYTLNISATDNCSGLDKVTVDGGKSWKSIEDGSYTVTKDKETTFAAGDIMVQDVAGNVFKSEEDYTVEEVESEDEDEEGDDEGGEEGGGSGGGGGGGGSGSGKAALPHASGDGEEGSEYDALTLDLPDDPMVQLTVGGEPMALTLRLASAQEPNAPVGRDQPFTARLRHWDDAADDDALNTLVLTAENDFDLGDVFVYEWRFNGEVYRMLANSGIKYMALQVGDTVAAFPTEGFTGGTKYTELKMQGVSTRRFDYTLTMKMNLNPSHVSAMSESDHSQECDLSIHAEVEEKNYELSNSPQSLMYYYNVFVGPEDMMDQPFGEYDENA